MQNALHRLHDARYFYINAVQMNSSLSFALFIHYLVSFNSSFTNRILDILQESDFMRWSILDTLSIKNTIQSETSNKIVNRS